jgi:hypothetical protein
MFRSKRLSLGGWLLLVLLILGISAIRLLSDTNLLWHGVVTQGVIVNEQAISCWRSGTKNIFSIQFTDLTGQVSTSTISQCDYSGFHASSGDSITIVYLPDDPTTIAPPDGLHANVQGNLIATILCGLITLILLPLWIRKRIRKASLQRQEEQAAAERGRAMEGHLAHHSSAHQD